MSYIRFYFAFVMAKLTIPLLKLTKHDGTNFPGEVALKLCPDFLKYIAKPRMIIGVTGTNGKTTVTNLVYDLMRARGIKVFSNKEGSNIKTGIATSLLCNATLFNKNHYEMAVLEIDERSAPRVYPYMQPDYLIINNITRDSSMRNAHPQYIASILNEYIPDKTKLIINADDLIASNIKINNKRTYFGIEKLDTDLKKCINRINDLQICPRCQHRLNYEYLRYHHIGKAYCSYCDFKSPTYDYSASEVNLKKLNMVVNDKGGSCQYRLISDSIFNAYNLLAAITLMRELGLTHQEIFRLCSNLKVTETRQSDKVVNGIKVRTILSKALNAFACSRVFDYLSTLDNKKEVVLMMFDKDDYEQWSENTSWYYDCDFEFLNDAHIEHLVIFGPRSHDYRLRLLLAGFDEKKIDYSFDMDEAISMLQCKEDLYILHDTDIKLANKFRDKVYEHLQGVK